VDQLSVERAGRGHRLVKVFIVSDMEGVAGIVKWEQTDGVKEKRAYHEGRELYTEEINAAVRGARTAGATEIVVMDCHGAGGEWNFNSLIPDRLDRGCEYVVQDHWTEYTDLLEQGCDAALFVGMHAKAGTPDGILSHTVSGQAWRELKFNGVSVGETGINAALCGQWGCPVLLVTGDEAVCREGIELLGSGLTTVAVKKGLGRFSARQIPALRAREMIENGARRALQDLSVVEPYDPGRPAEISVEFMTPDRVVEYRNRRGVEQVEELTLVSRADDWWTAWSQFYF
jgi:D-amino peptidase